MSLTVQDVSVVIGSTPVLTKVSFEVADREVVAVLGPSGSGKTTLLRVIAGLQTPTRGRILIDGQDVTEVPTHRRGVGLMFQDHALFPHRNVAQNVAFGLRMQGTSKRTIHQRVDEALELVGLAGFGARSIHHLSGGERQRVALARALAPRPSLLLLDEPLGALDRALRDRLLEDLGEVLAASGATVIHVTHDQAEAFATGERVVVMRSGTIAQIDEPSTLWRRPVDAEVASIVGPASVTPVQVRADRSVVAPWGEIPAGEIHVAPEVEVGPATMILRPDSLTISEEVEPAALSIKGTVTARFFRGDHILIRVALLVPGESPIEVSVIDHTGLAREVEARVILRLVTGSTTVVTGHE